MLSSLHNEQSTQPNLINMEQLKKIYDASRALKGHTSIQESTDDIGYSKSTIEKFFAGKYDFPDKVKESIIKYCYDAGMEHAIKKQGLDPSVTKGNLANHQK